jgi:hypothetical protein
MLRSISSIPPGVTAFVTTKVNCIANDFINVPQTLNIIHDVGHQINSFFCGEVQLTPKEVMADTDVHDLAGVLFCAFAAWNF